ncbi:MAG: hypothetical protein WA096_10625 [Smithella sp.]
MQYVLPSIFKIGAANNCIQPTPGAYDGFPLILWRRRLMPGAIIPSRADSRSGTIGWSGSPSQGSAQPGVIGKIAWIKKNY